jgi:HEAT repeat protein
VRTAAAEALGEIGELAASAIPHLRALWDDRSLYFTIRHAAGRALDKLGSPVDWTKEG